MADDLSALYSNQYDRKLGTELDRWLEETLREPTPLLPPRQQYETLVDELAPQYGQDPLMVKAMIQAESNWNPRAVSPKGAQGIAQFMPATARRFGVADPFDPQQAIPGMLKYLKTLSDEFHDPTMVVAAYNAGEGAVRQYQGVPPYQETQNYVRKVFGGVEGQPYTSKGEGVGPLATPAEGAAFRQQMPYTSKRAEEPRPEAPRQTPPPDLLDTALPSLAQEGMLDMSQEARSAQTYTSRGEGLGPDTFPAPVRFNPYVPGQSLEPSLEEPTLQRLPLRVMEGTASTLAGVTGLPITAGRLLGMSEQEAQNLFPQAAGLQNAFKGLASVFDPVGQEENIVDRFAQTVGQQIVFFGSGIAVAGGLQAIGRSAPSIARTLGATTAAVQEAGLEAQQTLDALTPLIGNDEAASRANTVFWRNVATLALTNRLGVFSEPAQQAGLLKIGTAAAMEGFQEVAQYDIGRRQFWVDARHPLARQLQAQGWKRHEQRVYQPFEVADAAEAGVLGAVVGGLAGVVRNAAGQEVLARDTEQKIRRGLQRIADATGSLVGNERGAISLGGGQGAAAAPEQAQHQAIRQRVQAMEDSQVRDDEGRLIRMYHGTATPFQQFDVAQADVDALYGPGLYFTDTPAIASGYAGADASFTTMPKPPEGSRRRVPQPGDVYAGGVVERIEETPDGQTLRMFFAPPPGANVRPVYLDIKQPFDAETERLNPQRIAALAQQTVDAWGATGNATAETLLTMTKDRTGPLTYEALADRIGKAETNRLLQRLGYDGIVHTGGAITGGQAHKVYIAFSPEQVIPSFELEAHPWFQSVLAYADRPTEEAGTLTDVGPGVGTQMLSGQAGAINPARSPLSEQAFRYAWRQSAQTEEGIPLARMNKDDARNWVGYTGQETMVVYRGTDATRSLEAGDFVTTSAEAAQQYGSQVTQETVPTTALRYVRGALTGDPALLDIGGAPELIYAPERGKLHKQYHSYEYGKYLADNASPQTGSLGIGTQMLSGQGGALNPFRRFTPFPTQPSPPPKGQVPTIGGGAAGIERTNFRDEQGRWRIPLKDMPSVELELQDFIRQQGGIRLQDEELQGELRALITRKETGIGGLQSASGATLQQIAEKAQELGFTPTADKVSLLEALDRSVTQGQLVYSAYATGNIPLLHDPQLRLLYQDVAQLAETLDASIEEQRRGTIPRAVTHAAGAEMIDQGLMTVEDIKDMMPGMVLNPETSSAMVQLLGRIAADAGTIAQAYIQRIEQGATQPGGGSTEEHSWLSAFGGVASTTPQRLGAMAEAGRSLGILNDPLSSTNQMLNTVAQLANQSPGMDSYKLAKKYLQLLESAGGKEAVQMAQKAITPGYGDMLLELYYQGMLSNPKTWLTNEVSNAATAAWALPVRLMSGMVSQFLPSITTPEVNLGPIQFRSLHLGGSGDVSLMETAAYAYGLQYMMQRAWQMSAEAFKTGQPSFGTQIPGIMEPIGQRKTVGPALTVANLQARGMNIDPNSPMGKFADFWFEWVGVATGGRLGSKIMESRDEFYKFLNYGGELGALAYRQAVLSKSIDPDASFADTMARILHDPLPEEMHKAAASHALIQTFQNELSGPIGRLGSAVQAWQMDVPGFGEFPVGRIILPFLHVAANIPRYALEHSPAGIFFKSIRDDLVAGGARADMAQGKMLMGTMTLATFALMASSGLLTGRGPEDKYLRDTLVRAGWQPYSAFVPWLGARGGYVSLRAFDPIVGQHAGIMSDIVEAWNEQSLEWYERMIEGPIFAVVSNIGSRSWMQGMSDFFDILAPRSRRAFEGESKFEGIRGFIRGRASALVPSVWGVAEKTLDPATQAAWSWIDGGRAKVPGWSEGMANYRNKWGDKRLLGWGWSPDWLNWVEGFTEAVNPLKITTVRNNPLDQQLFRDQIRLAMPTRTLGIPGVQGDITGSGAGDAFAQAAGANPYAPKPIGLNSHQYEKLVALASLNHEAIQELGLQVNDKAVQMLYAKVREHTGQRVPADNPGDLYNVLLWATTTTRYQDGVPGPQGEREEILKRIDSDFRTFGRDQLIANDAELRQKYLTGQALRELQQTPMGQRDRMRSRQERTLSREDERLRVGAP